VLINLILDARDACENEENSKISVWAEKLPIWMTIKVDENSNKVSIEILEKNFAHFINTKNSGSGISLCLSKKIMTLHNGRI
jgi:C4-dicarboxylate-specific signal transduction histidine kinase